MEKKLIVGGGPGTKSLGRTGVKKDGGWGGKNPGTELVRGVAGQHGNV